MTRSARPLALALFLAAASCGDPGGGDGAPGSGITVEEVDGGTVVRHSRDALEAAPALEMREVIRIGTVDGPPETQLFRPAFAARVDGEYWILDRGDHAIRIFGPDGAFRRSLGGEGDGPGELRSPSWMHVAGDTVAVLGRRLDLLDREGVGIGRGPRYTGERILGQLVPVRGGWLGDWSSVRSGDDRSREPWRARTVVHRLDPLSGELGDSVFGYLRPETRLMGEMGFHVRPFYQSQPWHAIAPDGRIFYTPGDRYRIDVHDPADGARVRRIEGDPRLVPVTDAMVDEAVAAEREAWSGYGPNPETEGYLELLDDKAALPTPGNRPVLGRLTVSPGGWLSAVRLDLDPDPLRPGDPTVLDVFDPDGRLHGRVMVPPGVTPVALLDDGLLAIARDDMDVPSVVHYAFERRPPGGRRPDG